VRLRTNGGNILISCSMKRVREPQLSWNSIDDTDRRFIWRIQESDVNNFKIMRKNNTLGLDNILLEGWRCLENIAIMWLIKLLNNIFGPTR
jgi:hypothetical protein